MVIEMVERVGVSNESISDAVSKVVLGAKGELNISWFEVVEQRGRVVGDKIEYQVKVKLGVVR